MPFSLLLIIIIVILRSRVKVLAEFAVLLGVPCRLRETCPDDRFHDQVISMKQPPRMGLTGELSICWWARTIGSASPTRRCRRSWPPPGWSPTWNMPPATRSRHSWTQRAERRDVHRSRAPGAAPRKDSPSMPCQRVIHVDGPVVTFQVEPRRHRGHRQGLHRPPRDRRRSIARRVRKRGKGERSADAGE